MSCSNFMSRSVASGMNSENSRRSEMRKRTHDMIRVEHVVRGHRGQGERERRAQTLLHGRVQVAQHVPHALDHIDVHTQGLPFMCLHIGHTGKHI